MEFAEAGRKGVREIFKKIVDELHSISASLKIIADAYKPVEYTGIKFITCKTNPTTQRTLAAFELGGHGWKKLEKSKEFSNFLAKLEECQKLDSQKYRKDS